MAIQSLSGVSGVQGQQNIRNSSAKLQAAIASIVSGKRDADVADVSIATKLQSETAGLRQVSGNLAQATSLTQVADGGAQQIQKIVQQLKDLAQQAQSPILNDANRKQLNDAFQKLADEADKIAQDTSFNKQKLLDGSSDDISLDSLLGSPSDGDTSLNLPSLTSSSLLGGKTDILSADSAGKSLSALSEALDKVTSVRAEIGSFQQTLDFASANIDSAIANQEAARSELQDTDFAQASSEEAQADVQRNASIALAAQGNHLSPALLHLIG